MRKLLVITLSIMMAFCFAACGSSGSGSEPEQSDAPAVEPNAGLQGIVYAIPDGWEAESEGNYATYKKADSGVELTVNCFDDEFAKEIGEGSAKEYYDSIASRSEKEMKENNMEGGTVSVCGTEGIATKAKLGDKGYYYMSTAWMTDGSMYLFSISNSENYSEDTGKLEKDAVTLTDEDIAVYDGIIASVAAGDGTQFAAGEEK